MAVIRKDKYIRSIASRVGKGEVVFESADRPALEMGGKRFYIGSVGFDYDSGSLVYSVSDADGRELSSAHGVRPVSALDVKVLSGLDAVVARYADLAMKRDRNLVNVESRLRAAAPVRAAGPGL